MEDCFEKPPKLPRLISRDEQERLLRELRELVRRLTKVPLSEYYKNSTPTAVDGFFERFADLLRRSNGGDARLFAQVHGMLLQWLDFIATQHPPRDITTEDDRAIAKVARTANQICCCLKEVYRCALNLHHFEGLLILVQALLMTTVRTVDEPQIDRFQQILPLLHSLQVVVQRTDANRLPTSLQQRFVLVLFESTAHGGACMRSEATNGESEALRDRNEASTVTLAILSHLASCSLTSEPTSISSLAQIALSSLAEEYISLSVTSGLTELFRMQCVLRHPAFQSQDDIAAVLQSLEEIAVSHIPEKSDQQTVNDLMASRFQALDCLIALASRCYQSGSKPPLASSLIAAFVQILSSSGSSAGDRLVKFQAVDGLRLMLQDDEMLGKCIAILHESQADAHKSRRFISSLVDNACCSRMWYRESDDHRVLSYFCSHVDNRVTMASAEILLSVLCILCVSENMNVKQVSSMDVAAICHSFLRQGGEHVTYLTVRTICQNRAALFFDITQMHPELLSSLAEVLCSDASIPKTKERILVFVGDLMTARPLLTPVIARQPGVVEAIATAASSLGPFAGGFSAHSRQLAANVLFELSSNVCNLRILARTHRVLASMIQYARDYQTTEPATATAAADDGAATLRSRGACQRQVMKERITQLAQVL